MKSVRDIPFDKLYVGMRVRYHNPEFRPYNGKIDYLGSSAKEHNQYFVVIKWDNHRLSFYPDHRTITKYMYYLEV